MLPASRHPDPPCCAAVRCTQALCALRKQQHRTEDALALLKQSMDLWFKPPKSEDEEEAADKVGDLFHWGGGREGEQRQLGGGSRWIFGSSRPRATSDKEEAEHKVSGLRYRRLEGWRVGGSVKENVGACDLWICGSVRLRARGGA